MANYGALSTIRRRAADVSRHFQFSSFHGFPSNFWSVSRKSDEARRVVFSDYKRENQSSRITSEFITLNYQKINSGFDSTL